MSGFKVEELDLDDILGEEEDSNKKIAKKTQGPAEVDIGDLEDFLDPDPNEAVDVNVCTLSWCNEEISKKKVFCSVEHEIDAIMEGSDRPLPEGTLLTEGLDELFKREEVHTNLETVCVWRTHVNQQHKDGQKPISLRNFINNNVTKAVSSSDSSKASNIEQMRSPTGRYSAKHPHPPSKPSSDPGDSRLDTPQSKETDSDKAIQTQADQHPPYEPSWHKFMASIDPECQGSGQEVPTTRAGSDQKPIRTGKELLEWGEKIENEADETMKQAKRVLAEEPTQEQKDAFDEAIQVQSNEDYKKAAMKAYKDLGTEPRPGFTLNSLTEFSVEVTLSVTIPAESPLNAITQTCDYLRDSIPEKIDITSVKARKKR